MKEVPNHSDELVPQETAREERPEIMKAEIEKMLDEVDFDCLKAIFQERRKELGVKDTEQVNFVGKDAVVSTGYSHLARYFRETNEIGFNYQKVDEDIFQVDFSPQERFLKFLEVLIHEECHAMAYCDVYNKIGAYSMVESVEATVGYQKDRHEIIPEGGYNNSRFFRVFNEAVVEMMSEEIFSDYCKQKAYDENIVKSFLRKNCLSTDYKAEYVPIIKKFITLISASKKQGYADIWQDLQRGYFEGKDLYVDKMTSWLNKTFGNDFLENLATLEDSSDIKEFSARLNKALNFVIKNFRTKEK